MSNRLFLPDQSRAMGIHMVASKGAGKSRLGGGVIGWMDSYRGIATAIFDPNGGLIDNWLNKFTRLPRDLQEQMVGRIRYVDVAAKGGWVVGFPLYYRTGDESLYTIAQRYLEVVRRIDPSLQKAPIMGWNPLWKIGTVVGTLLAACDLQITEAEDLMREPNVWVRPDVLRRYPEAEPAFAFLTQEFAKLPPQEQSRRADSFLNKISRFRFDQAARAIYGASAPGIDWNEVVRRGETVLIDFRNVEEEQKRLALLWTFSVLNQFMKGRGPGRHKPLSVILDEITYLLPPASGSSAENELLAADLEELVNRTARNNSIWLCLMQQEMAQTSEPIQKTLMTMGNQIIGSTTDPATALMYARRFSRYDPFLVKKRELSFAGGAVNERTTEFTRDDQLYLESRKFLELPRYVFLVGVSPQEGTMPTRLRKVSIERIDRGKYVDENLVGRLRQILLARSGRRVDDVLKEIGGRRKADGPVLKRTVRLEPKVDKPNSESR